MQVIGFFRNKVVKNASWLMMGKMVQMLLSFLVSILTARFLGPSNYGLINYGTAYTTFFASVCTLGINSIIVKNFVDFPEEQGVTIGTTLILRAISSGLSILTIIGIVFVIDRNEPATIMVVALCSISLIFQIFDTFNYWFQAKLKSKVTAIATVFAYLLMSVYKIGLLFSGKNVKWFALSTSIEYLVLALFLLFNYKRYKGPKLSFSIEKSKELLKSSNSYIIAGLMVSIYNSTDRLMLKHMLDESSVAYYSLAVSISTMWVFVLSAIIDSMFPVIMQYRNKDYDKYVQANKKLYALIFYVAITVSFAICLMAPIFIKIVYGVSYLKAVEPLRVIVWYTAFSYLGVARNAWVVSENKQKYLKDIYLGAAIINVVLNRIFIPISGASGAAFASLLTQLSTIFVMPAIIKEMQPNAKLMIDAVLLKDIGIKFKQR